ncbi:cytidine deaminase [Anoplolepis gracilipes]|uniref:cytidine deaminase n=1 Tax=Anoplolepis gracilipes TaxID=354296 RepID=UPI003BA10C52
MNIGKVVDFSTLDADTQELIKESAAVREKSYSPYSKFKVGAAIRCADGSISRGCNVENAAFPASVCAETTAIVRAVSDGKKKFTALAVVADEEKATFTTPCGKCRQVISEFSDNMPVYLTKSDMKLVLETRTNELFPLPPFHASDTETS